MFAILCAGLLGALGLVAGLWSEKFDQMAAFQSFVIMPMTFLSGVFYSIHSLPVFWQKLSHLNPFFYMIDGFRYGFFGQSDVSPWVSLTVVSVAFWASVLWQFNCSSRATKSEAEFRKQRHTMTAEQIQAMIAAGLACDHLEVSGDGRHWQAVVVSAQFEGLRLIGRHQKVYATLGNKMHNDEVHALSMKTFTPAEWAKAQA